MKQPSPWAVFLIFATAITAQAQEYMISTYAGGGPPPTPIAGPDLAVRYPQGMALDAAGNAYFAMLNCVFRMGIDGVVDRIAGTCRAGYSGDGGPAREAQFRLGSEYLNPPPYAGTALPLGIAIDTAGNIFIADNGNYRIRRISPEGIVATVAGNGTRGFAGDGGPAINAQISEIMGLAIDGAGDLFMADFANHRVRVLKPDGTISTVAGDGACGRAGDGGPGSEAELCLPAGLTIDAAGNLFVADSANSRIRRISADGMISTVVGCVTPTDSLGGCAVWRDGVPAAETPLVYPTNVAVDGNGNLYIADTVWDEGAEDSWQAVRKVTPDGVATTVAGGVCTAPQIFNCRRSPLFDGATANSTFLAGPLSLAPAPDGGVIIADGSTKIFKAFADGTIVTLAGNNDPGRLAGDAGPATNAQLFFPTVLAVDNSGNLFLYDAWELRVRKVSPDGAINTVAGNGTCCSWRDDGLGSGDGGPATSAQVCAAGLATDSFASLLIADSCGRRIRKVAGDGTISTVAGNGNLYSSAVIGDGGPATLASLWALTSIAVDRAGNLFIGETARIRKVTPNGIINTIAGGDTQADSGDGGPAVRAGMRVPASLAVDNTGALFIAETTGHRIRKISSDGIILTVAGNGTAGFSGDDGPATDAQLNAPTGIAVDESGNIFIADYGNRRIRRISADGKITTVAGNGASDYTGDGGPATSASMGGPWSVAVDAAGNVYFSDAANRAVRVLRPAK